MTSATHPASPEFAFRPTARFAGVLYLAIIVLGLVSEVLLRGPVLAGGADGLNLASALPLRQSLVADTLMVMADLGVAVLLYRLLAPYGAGLALAALMFRGAQAMVISANLLFQVRAVQLLDAGAPSSEVIGLLGVQAIGYDLGLAFFGVNCLLTALLLIRARALPVWLAGLIGVSGLVYLTGTGLRLLTPEAYDSFALAYLVPVAGESLFALYLLIAGGRWVRP
ncbi:MAG: DUF4386 domain-containing protein [Oceanicaulis sp.]|jgi:hypothetical protein|nr:DUF4386 domain-containing protein [Oceanicaulis sp.]